MISESNKNTLKNGFTLIEIIAVIVIIGILVTITMVSYGSWRKSTLTAQVKSDLNGVASAMESARTFNNKYPVALPTTVTASNGMSLSGGGSADGTLYCVDGASVEDPTITYYVDSSTGAGGAQQGTCATRPIVPFDPSGLAIVSTTASQINLSWTAAVGATGYTAQCALNTAFTVGMQQSTSATTTGSVTGLSGGSVYYCRVNATNATGSSGWSANVTTTTLLSVPSGLAVVSTAGAQINLSWAAATGATGYTAQCAPNTSFTTGMQQSTSATTTGSVTGLSSLSVYYCRVNATNATGSSGWSANVTATTTNAGVVTTLAGSGVAGFADGTGIAAQFSKSYDVAVDSSGTVYVADSYNHRIRKITPAGVVTTLAGSGVGGFADGTGAAAQFYYPHGIAVDSSGTVYVADYYNNRIRKITAAGVVTTLAGSGTGGFADGTGTAAQFNYPEGVAVDSSGTVYVGDTINNRIRKITSAGVVTTLAGSTQGYANGTGTAAKFYSPKGVDVDSSGTVYVADYNTHSIRKITSAGVVTTLAGGTNGFADGTGTAAQFNSPYDVAVDSSGTVYVADGNNEIIRKITSAGVVTTLAGSSAYGFADGTGSAAKFYNSSGVAVDSSGTVYVADTNNNRIRKIR